MVKKRGKFIVIDGLDGVGKGVFLKTFVKCAEEENKIVFDVDNFWKKNNKNPKIEELMISKTDIIITSEPTYMGIGKYIRDELISNNSEVKYSSQTIAEAYALDRRILYENLIVPALETGIDVYQSRSLSSSIVYQRQSAIDEGQHFDVKDILSIPGNKFCYENPMDYLLIPTIKNVKELNLRLENREKRDDCIFENLEFQLKLKEQYESDDFKKIFELKGVKVIYLDAGKSLKHSECLAEEFYKNNLK